MRVKARELCYPIQRGKHVYTWLLTERGETVLAGTGRNLVEVVNIDTAGGVDTFQEHPVKAGEMEEVGDDPTKAEDVKVKEWQAEAVF